MSAPQCPICGFWHECECPVTVYEREQTLCHCCGADLSREGHTPNCENREPVEALTPSEQAFYPEDDWEGGDDFDPYSGCEVFDRNEGSDYE